METKINQKKKIKPTLTKGVAKVPVVMQLEALECGAASLTMLMAYYGKWVPLEEVRLACGVSRDGSNAKSIYLAAQHYGFEVKAMRITPESLQKKRAVPLHPPLEHEPLCGVGRLPGQIRLSQRSGSRHGQGHDGGVDSA